MESSLRLSFGLESLVGYDISSVHFVVLVSAD
jgi:hypothetical protein